MKRLLRKLLLIYAAITTLNAQINPVIPAWVNPIDIKTIAAVNKKQIKSGFYYVLIDEQSNIIKKHNYSHYAISAITEEALVNVSQIEFSYDPAYEKAYLHDIKIHRGKEVINKMGPSLELKVLNEENQRNDGVLRGKKTLYTNLSDVRKGDVIEYCYSIIGQNPIMKDYFNLDLWLSYSMPIGEISMRVIFPEGIVPTIKNYNTELKPVIKTQGVNDYTWEVNNPKVTETESSAPSWYNPYMRVQVSNLKSWSEVKEHCKTLVKTGAYNATGLKKIMDSIVRSSTDLEKQISGAVSFVQTYIRYSGNENGIYSHVPRTPEFVLKNRFGDCKEKSVLLCEMLKSMNVEAYPVLINTSLGEKIKERSPSIHAFDHCIACFRYQDRLWFIDPTISYQRGNFRLRSIPSYEVGMVLDNSQNTFESIPWQKDGKESVLEEFKIDDSGSAQLHVTSVYNGANADEIRYFFLTNSVYGIQDSYKEFYTKYSKDIEVTDTVSFTDNEETNEFTVHEHYAFPAFWVKDSSGAVVKEFIPYSLNFKLNYGNESKRNDPLQISYPLNQTHTITVYKENGWNVEPLHKKEDNNYFSYSYGYDVSGNVLSLVYSYKSKTCVIEPAEYLDYKNKMEFINQNMVFTAQQNPLATGTIGFNWPLLTVLLGGLLMAGIFSWYLYKRPYKSIELAYYEKIGGWLAVVGFGIVLNPLSLIYSIIMQYKGEMGVNYAAFYFDERSTFFAPMQGYFSLFVALVNTMMIVFCIFLAIIFFQRKASFRPYYVMFRIFNVLFLLFDVIVLYSFYGDSNDPEERKLVSSETTIMFRVFFQSCIWAPYVWFSERSRQTFTVGNVPAGISETTVIPVPETNAPEQNNPDVV